ncbi:MULTISPECIES: adenylate/guanylate cyclase domain-containing protein [unclassified Bradyrhizobium]|uniref:adenylate/guanylate cyclase domain-containing protein n=1 Tax=unclassified Bradyrhizobium TaxID=2631580 RepID=UPI001FD960D6|nr:MULTISPECIES: adenylate/guanylate cyclase domain-containing protein [unclassified Bradyrhizobium]
MAKLQAEPATELQVRVGIATGMVVVGDLTGEGAAQEQVVIGGTPNLAARLLTFRQSRYRADLREYAPAH